MEYRTYLDLKTKVQRETDTEGEIFVVEAEIMDYFNDAINEAEAHIHKLGLEDDYFLTRLSYSLAINQKILTLPTNIYANKIKQLIFTKENRVYEIKRLRGRYKYSLAEELDQYDDSTDFYQYIIYNDNSTTGPYIELYPQSRHSGTDYIKMLYIRNMEKITADTSVVEIPEFYSFIVSYVKYKILNKEGSPLAQVAQAELASERTLMIQTLEEMVPDMDTKIEQDLTPYEEMS